MTSELERVVDKIAAKAKEGDYTEFEAGLLSILLIISEDIRRIADKVSR